MSKTSNLTIRMLLASVALLLGFTLLYAWLGFSFLSPAFVGLLNKVASVLVILAALTVLLVPSLRSRTPERLGLGDEKPLSVYSRKPAIIGGAMIGVGLVVVPVVSSIINLYFSWNTLKVSSWIAAVLMLLGLLLIINSFFVRREKWHK